MPIGAERQYVDPVFAPRDGRWCVSDAAADGFPASPGPSVPRSVLQSVAVALPEQIKPTQSPRRHGNVGVESATKIDWRQPGRAVVRHLVQMVVGAAEEDVDQVGPPRNRCRRALKFFAEPFELAPTQSVPLSVVERVVAASDEDIEPIFRP
jgi:hypothetical protein